MIFHFFRSLKSSHKYRLSSKQSTRVVLITARRKPLETLAVSLSKNPCFALSKTGVAQLLLGIEHIVDRDIIQNGIITDNAINLLFFAVILLLDIFVFIRKRLDKQSA